MLNHKSINRIVIGLLILGGLFLSQGLQVVSSHTKFSGQQGRAPSKAIVKEMAPTELGHLGHLDYLNGFRNRKFGTDISQFQDLTLLKDNGSQKTYASKTEQLKVGEGTLQSINYIFYKNRFMGVMLTAHGEDNRQYIYQVFVTAFGNGIRPPVANGYEEYFWTGKTTNARLTMRGRDDLELWIGSNSIQEEYDKEVKEKVLEAAAKSF